MAVSASRSRSNGFTLIEILIVVVVLGILAALTVPQFSNATTQAEDAAAHSQFNVLRGQMALYWVHEGPDAPLGDDIPAVIDSLESYGALGQYAGDSKGSPGYCDLDDVDPSRSTETYAALAFFVDNWRWTGTPFFLRSGKRLKQKLTEVVIQFRPPAANIFRTLPGFQQRQQLVPNRIVMEIAPRESIRVRFECKEPGLGFDLDTIEMDSDFKRRFDSEPIEAYGPLIIDAMRGDQTLFKHRAEVEGAWKAVMPFLDERSEGLREGITANYKPDSWGPSISDDLLARYGAVWHNQTESEGDVR